MKHAAAPLTARLRRAGADFAHNTAFNALGLLGLFVLLPGERLLRLTMSQVVLWGGFSLVLMAAGQSAWLAPGVTPEWNSVPAIIAVIALAIGLGRLLTWRTGTPARGVLLAVTWLWSQALAVLLLAGARLWLQDMDNNGAAGWLDLVQQRVAATDPTHLFHALSAWGACATGLALARGVPGAGFWRWPTTQAMAALLALFVAVYPLTLLREIDLQPDAEAPAASAPADESVMYSQPALLEQQLSALAPQRPGVTDLYFIGVAGDAGEPVFQREVQHVADLMQQRFDARGRTVLLINHEATRTRLPIASVTSLRAVLQRVGRIADPREDIVFIYLTSHGSPEHEFVLDYAPLPLEWLPADTLADLIRESGLGYRAVVISACYSGGFVAPLRDDRALVMTAADARSTSFGCGADTHYTWFGEALFRHALHKTRSLKAGFASARTQVQRWEKQDRYAPSNPQLAEGQAFAAQWKKLETRLEREDGMTPAATATAAARTISTCTPRCDGP